MQKNTLILKESLLVNFYGKLHAFLQKKLSSIFLNRTLFAVYFSKLTFIPHPFWVTFGDYKNN